MVGFAVCAVGDATWHTVFGIEQDINILFSPTHLGLAASMLVIVTTPLRSAWADPALPSRAGLRRLFPAVLSVALATSLVLLFLQYANAFTYRSEGVIYGLSGVNGQQTARLVGSFAVTTAVLVLPLLTVARRWALPFGTATSVFAFAGTLSFAVAGFHNGQLIAGLLVCGVCADALAQWLRPSPDSPVRYRLYAALVPLLVWTAYITIAWVVAGSTAGSRRRPRPRSGRRHGHGRGGARAGADLTGGRIPRGHRRPVPQRERPVRTRTATGGAGTVDVADAVYRVERARPDEPHDARQPQLRAPAARRYRRGVHPAA